MSAYHFVALLENLDRLRSEPWLAPAVTFLRAQAGAINAQLQSTLLAEIPAFTESRNPDTLNELAVHGPQHHTEIVRLLAQGSVGNFAFVREHACRCAEQRFPLEASLHAYRTGHKVFAHWMREAAITTVGPHQNPFEAVAALTDFAREYTDAISTIASGSYVEHTRRLADVALDQRTQLLNILLGGYDEADGRVAAVLRRAGYLDGRKSFCIVLAQSVDASEMNSPPRARRLAEAVDGFVAKDIAHRLIDVRDNAVVAVFSAARRQSGWTRPDQTLASKLERALQGVGNAVLFGVSADVEATARLPLAYRQATMALQIAAPDRRVVRFDQLPMRQLMVHLIGDELQAFLPGWVEVFHRADDRLMGGLAATVRAYADADMNALKAAALLNVHPNTVYARFQKITDLTGLDARSYHALSDLLMLLEARASPKSQLS